MTPERAKELLPFIEAYANGETIEKKFGILDWEPFNGRFMQDEGYSYRIKSRPEPREFWLCWNYVKDEGNVNCERPDANVYPSPSFDGAIIGNWNNAIKVREVL
jgi:hypothetical protein